MAGALKAWAFHLVPTCKPATSEVILSTSVAIFSAKVMR